MAQHSRLIHPRPLVLRCTWYHVDREGSGAQQLIVHFMSGQPGYFHNTLSPLTAFQLSSEDVGRRAPPP